MSYIINLTNGNVLTQVQDGTTNTNTGITLIGRNYTNYGQTQNDNFVRLLENFADANPPTISSLAYTPLVGTLWYDSVNQIIKVYDGSNWYPVSQRINASSAPVADNVGDQWYDTVNQQTKQWNGTNWQLIGPAYSVSQGLSGIQIESLTDSFPTTHAVSSEYAQGQLVSITSSGAFTLPNQYHGFTTITAGLNVANNVVINQSLTTNGTSTFNSPATVNAQLNSQSIVPNTTGVYNLGSGTKTYNDINLSGNIAFAYANIHFTSNNNLILHNRAYLGNVDIYVNSTVGNVKALEVSGSSGLITVLNDPTTPYQIATKNYVDNNIANVNTIITSVNSSLTSGINQLRTDTGNYMTANVANINANAVIFQTSTNANITAANLAISALVSNTGVLANSIQINNANELALANAIVTANTGVVSYVNTLNARQTSNLNTVNTNLTNSIALLATSTAANLATAVAPLATIASPTFTGTPKAPTPTAGDNSTRIATTAFVETAIANQVTYTVSSNPPSGTPTYSFWFQV